MRIVLAHGCSGSLQCIVHKNFDFRILNAAISLRSITTIFIYSVLTWCLHKLATFIIHVQPRTQTHTHACVSVLCIRIRCKVWRCRNVPSKMKRETNSIVNESIIKITRYASRLEWVSAHIWIRLGIVWASLILNFEFRENVVVRLETRHAFIAFIPKAFLLVLQHLESLRWMWFACIRSIWNITAETRVPFTSYRPCVCASDWHLFNRDVVGILFDLQTFFLINFFSIYIYIFLYFIRSSATLLRCCYLICCLIASKWMCSHFTTGKARWL